MLLKRDRSCQYFDRLNDGENIFGLHKMPLIDWIDLKPYLPSGEDIKRSKYFLVFECSLLEGRTQERAGIMRADGY